MSPEEGWSNAEIVRTLQRIEEKLNTYSDHFVPREIYVQKIHELEEVDAAAGKWLADTAASLERTNRALGPEFSAGDYVKTSTARWVVATLLTVFLGLLTSVIMLGFLK